MLNLVCLLDLDANTDGVDAGLDEDSLVLVSRNRQWGKEDFGRCLGFDLGNIMSLSCLRGEVGQGKRSSQAATHTLQVRPQ